MISGKRLLDRIRRHDLDAFDHHPVGRFAHLARAVSGHGRITDLFEHVVALDQFSERRVLMIETWNRRETDKNCDPAESGSELRAMEITPRSCECSLNSALIL